MTPNFIIGHEGVGVVEEVGPFVKNFKPGDRVCIPGGVACGICPECRSGRFYACEKDLMFGAGKNKGDLPGVQAEYTRIPYADISVVKIPDSVSTDRHYGRRRFPPVISALPIASTAGR